MLRAVQRAGNRHGSARREFATVIRQSLQYQPREGNEEWRNPDLVTE